MGSLGVAPPFPLHGSARLEITYSQPFMKPSPLANYSIWNFTRLWRFSPAFA